MKDKSMKSKSSKSKKDSKKSEPAPSVELTPRQLKEKKREEARARAAETRSIVTAGIGQWTGKLPAQLLNEYAQKTKWERVEYPVKNLGNDQSPSFHSFVILAKRNPKTKEIEKVKFDPPTQLVPNQPTLVEAKNFSATYAMHRVLSHQNMKNMLPPPHRDLWVAMDKLKLEAKPHEKYQWSEDPWQAQADRKAQFAKSAEEKEQKRIQREHDNIVKETRREMEEGVSRDRGGSHGTTNTNTNTNTGSGGTGSGGSGGSGSVKRIKFNHTLSMSRHTRSIIESVIRKNHGFKFSTNNGLSTTNESSKQKYNHILNVLMKLGFKQHFARESLEYSSTIGSALIWLLVHVPEDDIPKSFMPTELGITARVSSNVQIERAISALKRFGYSEDVALEVAELTRGDLRLSMVMLTQAFIDESAASDSNADSHDLWLEEIESIKCVWESTVSFSNEDSLHISMPKHNIKLCLYRSDSYPNSLPGIGIEPLDQDNVSKFVLLSACRQYAKYAYDNLRGDYMIMSLIEHVDETFEQIVKSPGKLSQVSVAVSGVIEGVPEGNGGGRGGHGRDDGRNSRKSRDLPKINASAAVAKKTQRMEKEEGKQMLEQRAQLPAWEKSNEIVSLTSDNRVVLVTGETGSGKSTQVVQFILDANPTAQIVCTQPRRISAIGVAQRVAQERQVSIGDEVGYVIKGEVQVSNSTQIRFVTSGVLLRILQSASQTDSNDESGISFQGITHIVVDEVHERSLDGDFLLILLKRLVQKNENLKVILMSATVDPKQFINYFKPLNVGYTHIKGRTFPVKEHFIDDVIRMSNYRPPMDVETDDIGKILGAIKDASTARVDYNLAAAAVHAIHENLSERGDHKGSILVFMSGAAEIDRTIQAIEQYKPSGRGSGGNGRLYLLPLHASLTPNEQRKVFQKPPSGSRKVVVSTNVAETSITISDIVAVVDSGRVKENFYDPKSNVSKLMDVWTSQASATQRMGRAGRVRAGECYKLYTENAFNRMALKPVPEILRAPLEVLYLQVKAMGINSVEKFLMNAIDPPENLALQTAQENLTAYGILNPFDNELTPLGKLVSTIPTDPKTAKMLVMGLILGCLPQVLTVSAILSNGKLPIQTVRDEEAKNERLFNTFDGINGDLIASVRAFEMWQANKGEGRTPLKSLVSTNECRNIQSARVQLISNLAQIGLISSKLLKVGESEWPIEFTKYAHSETLLKAIIGASLQPHIVEVVMPKEKFVSTASGAVKQEFNDDSKLIRFFKPDGERVFIHPRSLLFKTANFGKTVGYLSYNQSVMTTKHFIAEVTPFSIYSSVLFASRVDVDPLGNGIIVDKWTGLKCWPRVGILLRFLQQLLGEIMTAKFADPKITLNDHEVVQLVHDLLMSEGNHNGVGMLSSM